MRIKIDRAWKKNKYTISRLFVDGKRFSDGKRYCNILEDTDRGLDSAMPLAEIKAKKQKGKTAIPRGVYEVRISYSPRFGKKLPEVLNVPGYSGIRIHPGNTADDTEGCLLPGVNDAVGRVSNSRYWFILLYETIKSEIERGRRVYIEIG